MKNIFLILLGLLFLFVSKNILDSIYSLNKGKNVYIQLKGELENKKREREFLSQQLYYVRQDEYVEEQARSKLGLSKKDERIVIEPPHIEQNEIATNNLTPNWKKWWNLFF